MSLVAHPNYWNSNQHILWMWHIEKMYSSIDKQRRSANENIFFIVNLILFRCKKPVVVKYVLGWFGCNAAIRYKLAGTLPNPGPCQARVAPGRDTHTMHQQHAYNNTTKQYCGGVWAHYYTIHACPYTQGISITPQYKYSWAILLLW